MFGEFSKTLSSSTDTFYFPLPQSIFSLKSVMAVESGVQLRWRAAKAAGAKAVEKVVDGNDGQVVLYFGAVERGETQIWACAGGVRLRGCYMQAAARLEQRRSRAVGVKIPSGRAVLGQSGADFDTISDSRPREIVNKRAAQQKNRSPAHGEDPAPLDIAVESTQKTVGDSSIPGPSRISHRNRKQPSRLQDYVIG